jgi:hypothetical protein
MQLNAENVPGHVELIEFVYHRAEFETDVRFCQSEELCYNLRTQKELVIFYVLGLRDRDETMERNILLSL